MRVLLILWLVVNGVDYGGRPIEMPSMEACKAKEAELLAIAVPDDADFVSVECVIERRPGRPS